MRVAILLAAGSSRRFGAANKLFARITGTTLLARSLAIARAAPAARILVVTGAQGSRVAAAARGPRVTVVRAGDHAEGLAASLRAAARALRPCERAAYLFLADMPWIDPQLARRLASALRPGFDAARPIARGKPGHPMLARRALIDRVRALRGDVGLASLAPRIALVPADRRAIADVDHPAHGSRRRAPR